MDADRANRQALGKLQASWEGANWNRHKSRSSATMIWNGSGTFTGKPDNCPSTRYEEQYFPGHALQRCPSCLSPVPRQAIRCLHCWGYFLTKDDEIEEIRRLEVKASEVCKTVEVITPVRRLSQDVEAIVDGEQIRVPGFNVA